MTWRQGRVRAAVRSAVHERVEGSEEPGSATLYSGGSGEQTTEPAGEESKGYACWHVTVRVALRVCAGMTITPCDKEDLDMPNHLSGKCVPDSSHTCGSRFMRLWMLGTQCISAYSNIRSCLVLAAFDQPTPTLHQPIPITHTPLSEPDSH